MMKPTYIAEEGPFEIWGASVIIQCHHAQESLWHQIAKGILVKSSSDFDPLPKNENEAF
jgi:hypothetical protein